MVAWIGSHQACLLPIAPLRLLHIMLESVHLVLHYHKQEGQQRPIPHFQVRFYCTLRRHRRYLD